MMKPRVRELSRVSDSMAWLVTWLGRSKVARVSSCQMAANPSCIAEEMEYQVKRKLIEIKRETA